MKQELESYKAASPQELPPISDAPTVVEGFGQGGYQRYYDELARIRNEKKQQHEEAISSAPVHDDMDREKSEDAAMPATQEKSILATLRGGDLSMFEEDGRPIDVSGMRDVARHILIDELQLGEDIARQVDAAQLAPLRARQLEIESDMRMDATEKALAYEALHSAYAAAVDSIVHDVDRGTSVDAEDVHVHVQAEAVVAHDAAKTSQEMQPAGVTPSAERMAHEGASSEGVLLLGDSYESFDALVGNPDRVEELRVEVSQSATDVTHHLDAVDVSVVSAAQRALYETRKNALYDRLSAFQGSVPIDETVKQVWHAELLAFRKSVDEILGTTGLQQQDAVSVEAPIGTDDEAVPQDVEHTEREDVATELAEVRAETKLIAAAYEEALREHYAKNKIRRFGRSLVAGTAEEFTGELKTLETQYAAVRQRYVRTLKRALDERRERKRAKGQDTGLVFDDEASPEGVAATHNQETEAAAVFAAGAGLRAAAAQRFVFNVAERRKAIRAEAAWHSPAVDKALTFIRKHKWSARAGAVVAAGALGAGGTLIGGLVAGGAFATRMAVGAAAGAGTGALVELGVAKAERSTAATKEHIVSEFSPEFTIDDYDALIKQGEFKEERLRNWRNTSAFLVGGAASIGAGMATAAPVEAITSADTDPTPVSQPTVDTAAESAVLSGDSADLVPPKDDTPPLATAVEVQDTSGAVNTEASVSPSQSLESPADAVTATDTDKSASIAALETEPAPTPLSMEYTVASGDTLWNLMESRLTQEIPAFAALDAPAQEQLLSGLFEHVDKSDALRDAIGMRSDSADLIMVGEILDLTPLQNEITAQLDTGAWSFPEDAAAPESVPMGQVGEESVPTATLVAHGFTQGADGAWHLDTGTYTANLVERVEGEPRTNIFGNLEQTTFERMEDMPMHHITHPLPDAELLHDYRVQQSGWQAWHNTVSDMEALVPPDPKETLGEYMNRYLEVQEAKLVETMTVSGVDTPDISTASEQTMQVDGASEASSVSKEASPVFMEKMNGTLGALALPEDMAALATTLGAVEISEIQTGGYIAGLSAEQTEALQGMLRTIDNLTQVPAPDTMSVLDRLEWFINQGGTIEGAVSDDAHTFTTRIHGSEETWSSSQHRVGGTQSFTKVRIIK